MKNEIKNEIERIKLKYACQGKDLLDRFLLIEENEDLTGYKAISKSLAYQFKNHDSVTEQTYFFNEAVKRLAEANFEHQDFYIKKIEDKKLEKKLSLSDKEGYKIKISEMSFDDDDYERKHKLFLKAIKLTDKRVKEIDELINYFRSQLDLRNK